MQWQFDVMLKWGNDEAISMGATFGTNHMKYYLFTSFVFNDFWHGCRLLRLLPQGKKKMT